MGDGVNIAARLEGIAQPGAICLSEDAYRQVKGRLDVAVSDLGPIQLKNIAEPVRIYSLGLAAGAQTRSTGKKAANVATAAWSLGGNAQGGRTCTPQQEPCQGGRPGLCPCIQKAPSG
jgi:hypothetical protein